MFLPTLNRRAALPARTIRHAATDDARQERVDTEESDVLSLPFVKVEASRLYDAHQCINGEIFIHSHGLLDVERPIQTWGK
jgi:hypothetical protein